MHTPRANDRSRLVLTVWMTIFGLWPGVATANDPSPQELRRGVVTSIAFSPSGRKVVASYYAPAINRAGSSFSSKWVSAGSQIVLNRSTWPSLDMRSSYLPARYGGVVNAP